MAYVGTVHYAKGIFVGVIMDDSSMGKNNGMEYDINNALSCCVMCLHCLVVWDDV